MGDFFEVFYRKIPSITFEPIAICGIAGLILAAFLFRKEWKERFYLWVFLTIVFMIFWRMAIKIISSRYGLPLMIPFTIATSFLFFNLDKLKIKKIPEKYLKYLPYFCIAMIVIAGIGRTLCKDPYQTFRKTGLAIKQDIQKNKEQKLFTSPFGINNQLDRPPQLSYYSSLPPIWYDERLILKDGKQDFSIIKPIVLWECHRKESKHDALYFFLMQESKSPVLTAALLQLPENSFTLVSSEYRNRKKKKILRVYRYIPPQGTFRKPLSTKKQ